MIVCRKPGRLTALAAAVPLAASLLTNPISAAPELETMVVTGTYTPESLQALTASISVLDEQQLQQLNKRQLGDVLRTVPGLLVDKQGGSGGLTTVSIRGGEPNFTQVLLDGIPLNDPTNARGGSYDIGNINSAGIARVEVVRGPQSAVYGSDALAGVINLISHNPLKAPPSKLRVELGEDGYSDYSFSGGAALDEVGVAVDLGHRDDDGWQAGSSRRVDNANLRLHWQPSVDQSVSAQLRYLEGERSNYPEQSGGPMYAQSEALDNSDYTDLTAGLAWELQLSANWRSRLAADYFDHSEVYSSPGVAPYQAVPANGSDTDFERSQLRWVNTLQLAPHYQVNLGADYRDESGESIGYVDLGFAMPTDYALQRSSSGLFVDVHAQPLDKLLLQFSARYDNPDQYDDETTLKLGASYELLPSMQLSANWGEGYKLPSFFALGHALVGNPELQPETVEGWDMTLHWQAHTQLGMSLTAFGNRYRNLVDFDSEAFTNVNRREVETRGGEWQLEWQPLQALSLKAHATYTDIDVIDEDARLLGRPQWQAGAWLNWQFADSWYTGLDYEWTAEVPASSLYTGQSVVIELEPYQRVDWRLGWRAMPALELELALDNVLDENYQTAVGFAGIGRSFRAAATLHFGR